MAIQEFQVRPPEDGTDLLRLMRDHLQISGKQAKGLLDRRTVFVNGKRTWMAKHTCRAGDVVTTEGAKKPQGATRGEIHILHEDPHLLGIDKPAGQVSDREKQSVEACLRSERNEPTLRALHRLDRDTTGVLLFTRNPETREAFIDLFRDHKIRKQYRVIVRGTPQNGACRKPIAGKTAETQFRILARHRDYSLVECGITTGRTHQIRRHLQMMNCSVAGDRHYGTRESVPRIEQRITRQMLHAASVEFECPVQNNTLRIHTPTPPDFNEVLKRLGLTR